MGFRVGRRLIGDLAEIWKKVRGANCLFHMLADGYAFLLTLSSTINSISIQVRKHKQCTYGHQIEYEIPSSPPDVDQMSTRSQLQIS